MKTVILCGGKGTRLREETEYRPKPLVNIGNRPILWHIMKNYAQYGYNDFVLCLGYRGWMIKEYFLNYEAMNNDFTINLGHSNTINYHNSHEEQDFTVTLAETGTETQTGGRIKAVERYLKGDYFMVTYGDGVSDLNISRLVEFHHAHGRLATISTVHPISRYGTLSLDDQNRVTDFSEKPKLNDWINCGFFVFHRKVLDYIDNDPMMALEHIPLERLAAEKQLVAYKHDGFFLGMDTYKDQLYLTDLWERGKAPWKVW